jgi:hypothetical protein
VKIVGAIILLGAAASVARGQGTCRPDSDSNEAKMLAFFAAPIAFSPAGTITPMRQGEVRLSLDATYVPSPGDDITSPDLCYRNDKTENTELSPVFPRPRIAIGLARGLALEATYLPPLTVMDATPNLFALALAYARPFGTTGMSWAIRTHVTVGSVKGPITCSPDVIQTSNPAGACYATQPSEDTYKPNMVGFEGVLGFGGHTRFASYIGAGYTLLRPRFQVGYLDAAGNLDDTEIIVDLNRFAAFAGGTWKLTEMIGLTAELYSVPQDVTTFRLGGAYTLRAGRR